MRCETVRTLTFVINGHCHFYFWVNDIDNAAVSLTESAYFLNPGEQTKVQRSFAAGAINPLCSAVQICRVTASAMSTTTEPQTNRGEQTRLHSRHFKSEK